jgi:hypothetical protein
MWIEEMRWQPQRGWQGLAAQANAAAGLVLYFGNRDALRPAERFAELRAAYPAAHIMGCSATCSIVDDRLDEDGIVAVAASRIGSADRPQVHR